jgi:hypothetical protein
LCLLQLSFSLPSSLPTPAYLCTYVCTYVYVYSPYSIDIDIGTPSTLTCRVLLPPIEHWASKSESSLRSYQMSNREKWKVKLKVNAGRGYGEIRILRQMHMLRLACICMYSHAEIAVK